VLDEPLKRLGVFQVPVRLHQDVVIEIEVHVERSAE
jgi:ribosomal protein L9